jgi:hypothetical protein
LALTHDLNPKGLRVSIVAILVVLSVQAWSGDVVNIFLVPPNGTKTPSRSPEGFLQVVQNLGPLFAWHVYEGVFLIIFSAVLLGLSFKWSIKRSVRISAILAFFFMLSAALGGVLFVLSGLENGGNSAQMGGSFIAVYAFYFIELYFSK